MKLTIFGATGRIGGHLLNWAVDAGHDVHVLARSPQALRPRDGLTVTGGDVLDPAAVAVVISGADAVLSAVGGRRSATTSTTPSCSPRPPRTSSTGCTRPAPAG
jgi:putative NADH-flavin reductase